MVLGESKTIAQEKARPEGGPSSSRLPHLELAGANITE